ncbi:MAG TPA: hypothetical protein VH062_24140 [Polyangiaceae bacterium]|jgi:hypothetical protein|nr:hypothetical protein [Polyangiaceae bacterium]
MANPHLSTTLAEFDATVQRTKNRLIAVPASVQMTTDAVLIELGNFFARSLLRLTAIGAVRRIRAASAEAPFQRSPAPAFR